MVKQRGKNDCGIAAVANAVGVSYRRVKDVFGPMTRGGMERLEMLWILSEFGDWRRTRPRRPMSIAQWLPRHRHGRYILVLDVIFAGHMVAAVDGVVHGETFCDILPDWYWAASPPETRDEHDDTDPGCRLDQWPPGTKDVRPVTVTIGNYERKPSMTVREEAPDA